MKQMFSWNNDTYWYIKITNILLPDNYLMNVNI